MVVDIAASCRFYVDVLGFEVWFERTDPGFVYLALDGAQLMLEADHETAWRTDDLQWPRGRGMNLQIEVPDARALHDAVLASGREVFRGLMDTAYDVAGGREVQREFLVQDPDGYLLRLAEIRT